MRDYGNHILPVYSVLPATGVAGQHCVVGNQHFYWHTAYAMWVPIDEWFETVLTANYSSASTTMATVFSFPAVANADYEIEWKLIWNVPSLLLATAMKQAMVFPTGAVSGVISTVSAVKQGATAPTFLELGTSGTSATGPNATAATPALNTASGLVLMGTTAGTVAVQIAPSSANTMQLLAGSVFRYRRIA